jgi:N-acetylglucosaminyldiphosphoundecaprenol N-acetyl-beta-D-mannosaminyltransferase
LATIFMSSQVQLQPVASVHLGSTHRDRVAIGQAFVDRCSFDQAVSDITAHAVARGAPAYVVTPNAQHIVLLSKEPRLREIYHQADLVVADGFSLVLAARALGRNLPERVAGVDLFEALCGSASRYGLRVFLLGGRPGSADLAASLMAKRYPNLQINTYCPPFGFESSEIELARARHVVTLFGPAFLFVALGAPKQEYWIYDHGRKLGASVCLGVGGSFELVTGIVPRAPRWIQRMGCEWLFRLYREPRRMWRRYLVGNVQFAWIVLQQAARGLHPLPNTHPRTSAGDRA